MVDVAHGINSMLICMQEATSRIKRSMSSSLKYLQSKQAAERNSTSEREALSKKPHEEKRRLAYLDVDRMNTKFVWERERRLKRRVTNLVWELPKFGLLMATLAAGVSYSSGVRSDNDGAHLAEASVLRDTYLRSYRALYHFIASSLRWWLCTLSIFYIIELLFAVRSCCRLAISALFARDCGNKVASEAPETLEGVSERLLMIPAMAAEMICVTFMTTPGTYLLSYIQDDHLPLGHRHSRRLVMPFLCFNNTVSRVGLNLLRRRTVRWHGQGFCSWALRVCMGVAVVGLTTCICFSVLVVAVLLCIGLHSLVFLLEPVKIWVQNIQRTLQKIWVPAPAAALIYQAFKTTPDVFFLWDMVVLALLFFPSLAVLTLLMKRTVTGQGHGFCSRALWVFSGVVLIGLTSVLTVWSHRSLMIAICFSASAASILFCIGLEVLVFLGKPVDKGGRDTEETLQKSWKQWDTVESVDHRYAGLSDPQGILQKSPKYLLHLVILVATITYQAGLKPPGGLWETNATDGLRPYCTGDPILHTTYLLMCHASFAAALLASLLLLSNMFLDLLGLLPAHATGSCSKSDPVVDKDQTNSRIKGTPLEGTWRVACAAPHHMTGNKSLMLTGSYMPVHDSEVIMVYPGTNGEVVPLQVRGRGSVRTESVTLDDVWYVPGLDSNLVSTGQLARQGCAVNLGPGGCSITTGGALVGAARFTEACQFELDFLKVA